MIVRGTTCYARGTVRARAAAPAIVGATPAVPVVVTASPRARALFSAGVQGRDGPQGLQGVPGASAVLATYTAAVLLSGDKALMFAGAGVVVPADPTSPGYVFAGISIAAAQGGAPVAVQSLGDVQADFWAWTPDRPVFVASAGNLTQSPPATGWLHLIGWALDARTIHLAPSPPKLLQ